MKILYHGRTWKEDQEKCLGKDWRDSTRTYGFLTVLLRTPTTDKPPCVTTSNKRLPIQNSVKALQLEPLVNEHLL